ncbi:hypothetical protein L3Q82_021389 [Scortum barcoo]|uniref:Uncharacterized protein n=1 Tax=Scortum barcoo TaxID=214431 RepID=A0ACB8X4F2_9TELE|nr:hypothetical protein L3Q82_021389 [Scortum barcoo]
MRTLMLLSALFAGLFGSSAAVSVAAPAPKPYHAFCRTMWLFATPCAEISATIVQQIEAFSPMIGCDECQYMLLFATPGAVKAKHTSPDGRQAESITFALKPNLLTGGCRVSALSTSLGFTSRLDDGLNYCNLYNLISASGLTSAPGFMEMTDEWACLGYGPATCRA